MRPKNDQWSHQNGFFFATRECAVSPEGLENL